MRILIGGCQQEISTFNPVPCEYEFFDYLRGDEIRTTHEGTDSQIGGALAELQSAFGDDLEVVYTFDAEGTAAGPLRHNAFLRIAEEFLDSLKPHTGKIDGVYFSMHGAMGTTELLDPEGYLLEEARKILGNDVPIVITMDLHGILTAKMLENINGLTSFHTYPHVDFGDTGKRAAQLLTHILKDGVKPVAARVRVPAIVRGNELLTESGAFGAQIRYAKKLHENPKILSAGFFICNPFTDVPELSSQAYVFTDDDPQLAEQHALQMANDFWPNRHIMQGQFIGLEESVAKAAAMAGPIAFTDAADAPSSGSSGDSNSIISEMIRTNYPHSILAPIADPAAAAKAHELGVGAKFTMGVGGAHDPQFTALELEWSVESLTDGAFKCETWKYEPTIGPSAVLKSRNLTLVVTTATVMLVDRGLFFKVGLDPKDFHSIIVKSPHCEPAFYDDWVEANFNVDAPGATSANLKSLGHTVCSRPIYPLEPDTEFNPQTEVFTKN
ncbi:MAG: M81 family metallopeptidase [Dehalococcoidia bacterium]|jgi:microcystin degradation protein MlrC|nr:microcystin degradation protein MlrC [Chloroflexota bacterium]MDP7261620.1 M81 family metallopeptidase [Dehalococcoidia bacterium]